MEVVWKPALFGVCSRATQQTAIALLVTEGRVPSGYPNLSEIRLPPRVYDQMQVSDLALSSYPAGYVSCNSATFASLFVNPRGYRKYHPVSYGRSGTPTHSGATMLLSLKV
jgi:hypothetical protein